MGETWDLPMDRKPVWDEKCQKEWEDCDFIIEWICKAVKEQNSGEPPVLLKDYNITKKQVILTFEIPTEAPAEPATETPEKPATEAPEEPATVAPEEPGTSG